MLPIILQLPPKRRATTLAYTNKVIALSPIAYWPLAESSGSTATDESGNARNGAYTSVTLGATGIGDGRTAAAFTTGSFCNIYGASLAGAFNGQEGSLSMWAQVSAAGIWTDGTNKALIELQVDASNVVRIRKTTTNNISQAIYTAGGTNKTVNITNSATTWFHLALTWSKIADQFKVFLNGAQVGATQTALGTFAGSLVSTAATIGAANTSATIPWSGQIAHVALFTSILSGADITALATV
jgi:hypothetical protein